MVRPDDRTGEGGDPARLANQGSTTMQIDRTIGPSIKSRDQSAVVAGLRTGCVGCADCKGTCLELVETVLVPDLVLKSR